MHLKKKLALKNLCLVLKTINLLLWADSANFDLCTEKLHTDIN